MAFFSFGKNRNVSTKRMQRWLADHRLDKVVDVLSTGNTASIIRAIEVLRDTNMASVKRELIALANHKNAEVSQKAREVLELMGLTAEERQQLQTPNSK